MPTRGHIDDKTMEYLTPEDPKPGRFYLLPKIHKENNPGRPIVSANGHPTEKISDGNRLDRCGERGVYLSEHSSQ
jgi:hypothetical protein